jgi:hypothetical protein
MGYSACILSLHLLKMYLSRGRLKNKERMLNTYLSQGRLKYKKGRMIRTSLPTIVAYNSEVKLFLSIIIFNTCDEWTLHHDMCSMSFPEVLT